MSKTRKKIVCFGGGSGMPKLILKPLKDAGFDMVGITSMVDNGGSTGALRREFGILPPGDIRRHLLALADLSKEEEWKEKLWNFRFGNMKLSPGHFGHNFANAFIGGLQYTLGDFEKTLEITGQFLHIKGKALPATLDSVQVNVELEDGTIVNGEDEIDVGENHDRNLKIKRAFLDPGGKGYSKAIEEIKTADFIIVGPGDMYSSLVPCFLADGIKEAISESNAKRIFICSAMTKLGETQGMSVSDFAVTIEKYIGTDLDFVIYNTGIPSEKMLEDSRQDFAIGIPKIDENLNKNKFIGKDLLPTEGEMKYDKEKLITILEEIING